MGETVEAISHHETAIRLRPESAVAHYNLGKALQKIGSTSEAISHYQKAIELKPDSPLVHNNLS